MTSISRPALLPQAPLRDLSPHGFALSPLQEGMLFHWLLDRHTGTDIEQIVGDLDEPIDAARLNAAWQAAVDHFSTLRIAFSWEGLSAPRQHVEQTASVPFTQHDLRHLPPEARELRIQKFLRDDRRTGFDLASAPLMRVTLFRTDETRYRMVWTFHHILIDGRAFEVILNDVFSGYAGGDGHALPDRKYREYIDWITTQDHDAARAFWHSRLAGFTTPSLMRGVPAEAPDSDVTADRLPDGQLSLEATRRLRALAAREGLSLNSILLGAWAVLVAQESGRSDVIFGASKTTRRGTIPDADSMVGMFLATIPVRVVVDPALSVAEWLRTVRAAWVSLRGNEHLPLVEIRRTCAVPSASPLFDSLVVFENSQLDTMLSAQGGPWARRTFSTYEQTSVPLTLLAYGDDRLTLRLEFDPRQFARSDATRWLAHVETLLMHWGADASHALSESPVLAERASVRSSLSVPALPSAHDPTLCVHEQFEAQVSRTPNAIAVVFGDVELTYRQVNAHANRIALDLRARGAGPQTLVGICMDRSAEMVIALLAILKSGAAYVPLDPAYPADRLTMMLEDAHVHTVMTESHLVARLGSRVESVLLVDRVSTASVNDGDNVASGVGPDDLAYVIFTSGSTGRPKGTMIEHRNVSNFLAGMDEVIAPQAPGVWLAVTSISFDISVLELFWTLARGFEVVVAPAQDRASIEQRIRTPRASTKPMDFGLFYFAAHSGHAKAGDAYRLLIEGAKFADTHGFTAVWTPERHFHAFGGFYPNPAVTTAALSTITSRVQLRAGSIVLPLHNPLRVAEDWAVLDQLSGGRVGLSFASGWHANDFALMPGNFERRRDVMNESIETVLKLWRGESISVPNGAGKMIDVSVLPRPIQSQPPIWIASAGSVETFVLAGRLGANVLTNMLGQDLADLKVKFAAYHEARRAHGHDGNGTISVMLHTFVTDDSDEARRLARKPFSEYLASSYDLVKVAPTMFPAFRQPSRTTSASPELNHAAFTDEDMAALLDHAFDRYFDTAGLFGTPERALALVDQLAEIGATEVACLIDFGIDPDKVLDSLVHLDRLRRICAERSALTATPGEEGSGIAALIRRRGVTHLQCTPSVARALADDAEALAAMAGLDTLLLGGEALPPDLAERLGSVVRGRILNMYGPTETTVWSTTAPISRGASPTIGRPIRNTFVYVLDEQRHPVAAGTPGELYIGGDGVVRGYLDRPDLTAERFLPNPFEGGGRIYRTGDLVRQRTDGVLEYLGRIDDQVKIDGFRIELGEIEATLARHASVRQAVVVAHATDATEGGASHRLFAYVVPASADPDADRIGVWQHLWNETYERSVNEDASADPRFRIAGWNDSYTGQPIPSTEMREWVQDTADRIVELQPRRVLEIGCGTGLLLYRVLPHVEHYTGVDISPAALDSIRHELTAAEAAKVTLLETAADELTGIAPRSVDLVVINSVAQYFPNATYLEGVLRRASEIVSDGGQIFVGDVRSLEHLELFHTALELSQASSETMVDELPARIDRRIAQENELVVSPAFFDALLRTVPRLSHLDVQLKRGMSRNEMTMFRYDVVLTVNGSASAPNAEAVSSAARDIAAVTAALAAKPDYLYLMDVPNARLAGVSAAAAALGGATPMRMEELRGLLTSSDNGVDPEVLRVLNPEYDVRIRWSQSGDPGRFDAMLHRATSVRRAAWPTIPDSASARHTNIPAARDAEATLARQLRAHLRQTLPEYMMPASFTMLETLPLTPNGKIDRKALPLPARKAAPQTVTYAAPTGDLEQMVADVWRDLLAVDQVGRKDNIFDLGANSLLAMQANSRLSTLLGRSLPLVTMFRYPTVASLSAFLAEGTTKAPSPGPDKRARDRSTRSEEAAARRRALRGEREGQ